MKRYRLWAETQELLEGAMPGIEVLQSLVGQGLPVRPRPQNTSSVEPYRTVVKELVEAEVETAAIYQRLKKRGFTGSYSGVYRFLGSCAGRGPLC